jgi:nucleotide-binding universal stress UspA family protein
MSKINIASLIKVLTPYIKADKNFKRHYMPKTILIAIDYAPSAKIISEMGYELAEAMQAEICLLHIISNKSYYDSAQPLPDMGVPGAVEKISSTPSQKNELRDTALNFLENIKNQLGTKTSITTMIKDGNPADEILETAKTLPAYIIVLGTHSRGGLSEILMGSVADKVLHHASIPLFLIPTKNYTEKPV